MIRTLTPSQDQLALSNVFLRQARVDNAGGGYCAKGVANLLEHIGLGCQRGDAYTWKSSLPQNGWIKLEGITPENAPPGAVLVYDRSPNSKDKGGGTEFGHVEIATVDKDGNRQYVSDKARTNWGGTVPQNFVGVYVHPSLHKTNDGINYTPNLDPRGGTTLASNQTGAAGASGSNARDRQGAGGDNTSAGYDPAFLSLINGNNASNTPGQDGASASNSDNFNGNANMSAFLVLAMVISAVYGVDMDTRGPRIESEGGPAGTERPLGSPVGAG